MEDRDLDLAAQRGPQVEHDGAKRRRLDAAAGATGHAPMDIKTIKIYSSTLESCARSTVLNPAVRALTA